MQDHSTAEPAAAIYEEEPLATGSLDPAAVKKILGDVDFQSPVKTEAAVYLAIRKAAGTKFVHGAPNPVYMRQASGFWTEMDGSADAQRVALSIWENKASDLKRETMDAVRKLLEGISEDQQAQIEAMIDAHTYLSDMVIRSIAGRLRCIPDNDPDIEPIRFGQMDDYRTNPVLGVVGGGSLSLLKKDHFFPADETATFNLLDHGWAVHRPNYDLVDEAHAHSYREGEENSPGAIIEHFYGNILPRLAYLMFGPTKCVDAIRLQEKDTGKSTLINAMTDAFPNIVDSVLAPDAFKSSSRFTPELARLASCRILFVNEVDKKPDHDFTPFCFSASEKLVDIESKGTDMSKMRNMGTVVFVGNDWPNIDTSVPGMNTRLEWAYSHDAAPTMTKAESLAVQSAAGLDYLVAAIFSRAHELAAATEPIAWDLTPYNAVRELLVEKENPIKRVLLAEFIEVADSEAFTPNVDLKQAIKDAGLPVPGDRAWGKTVRSVFPHARDSQPSAGNRGYYGIARRQPEQSEQGKLG